jgi:pimeloyl-ACP methyl ester carboxylesterase
MHRRDLLSSLAAVATGRGLASRPDAGAGSGGSTGNRISATRVAATTPFVETPDGTHIFYKDWGAGPPVVFCHGGVLGADMWEYQMTALAGEGVRCIAHDRRGCARSTHPGRGYDFDTFAGDLAALLEGLDLRDVTLVGHSMGCAEIARYLARHGARRVARSVLVSTTTPFLLKTPDNPDGVDKRVFDEMVAELQRDRPHFTAQSAPGFFGIGLPNMSISPEIVQWGIGLALQACPKATIDVIRAFSETDFRPDLRAFTMPTLLIHGRADRGSPLPLTAERTATRIPGSRLEIYDTGHGLFITEKERLNRDLLAFIRG